MQIMITNEISRNVLASLEFKAKLLDEDDFFNTNNCHFKNFLFV